MSLNDAILRALGLSRQSSYGDIYVKVEEDGGVLQLRIGQMYDAPRVTFENLKNLSELFGTDRIDVDHYSKGGCETCDYGSDYGHTIQIIEPTKNGAGLKALVEHDLMRYQTPDVELG